jgi:Cys-tRNA(Pro) deacylase
MYYVIWEPDGSGLTQGIEDYLRNAAIDFKVHVVNGSTTTCQDAATQLQVPLKMIIKTIVFTDEKNSPIIAILTGDKRADKRKLSATVGALKVRIATPEATKEFTGFEVGVMPPVGHKVRTRTVIDQNVMTQSKVYGGYGIPKVLIEIGPRDIAKLADAKISDISE